ncbi:nucleotide exchange factor GrpE [Ligilactobacillus ruminis]|uniref:Protein GrpE n=1 Tax=Ligilactobacillus ruminis TaxID=1623 RepID=A0AAQ2XP16_9LACO|nr:nucleotide exchange factor GrpE [Ligilactobacillus ruminis]KLA43705.1 heat shock protein GrpE [Ligilactobacillus ruminis]MCI5768543.1 nucleotide exchange factor GrpE [Ligilactobacillus ruminis]MDD5958967.1 nucleotide exchange factor GrpE [Ligilactobacillus ruminis]NME32634.1 nucleotide exchange factor GrpE [Ligilactobacillus ruminis]WDC80927.1 nucleotide exchange factor GrpE [Ligilactobacillus ruminis]
MAEKDQEKKPEVSEKENVTAEKTVDQDTAKKEPEKKQSSEETEKKLSDLQKKYDELEDKYLRAEAEMQNMTKRFKKEQQQLLKYEGQDLIREILPVIDNLNRALQIDVKENGSEQLKRGIEMVQRDMEKALKENDVTKIEALGQTFDPTLHQAVKTVPVEEGQEAETIVEVYQDGYMLKDRVLRPAMVVVAQ